MIVLDYYPAGFLDMFGGGIRLQFNLKILFSEEHIVKTDAININSLVLKSTHPDIHH